MRIIALVLSYLFQLVVFMVLLGLEQVGGAIILSATFFLLSISRHFNLVGFTIFCLCCSFVLSTVSLIPWWQSFFLLFIATTLFFSLRKLAVFAHKVNLAISVGFLVIGLLVSAQVKPSSLLVIQAIISFSILIGSFFTPFWSRLANKQWTIE